MKARVYALALVLVGVFFGWLLTHPEMTKSEALHLLAGTMLGIAATSVIFAKLLDES